MQSYSRAARLSASVIAAAAWLGLGLYLAAEIGTREGDVLAALWVNLGFLTDLSNLITATVFTAVSLGFAPLSRAAVVGWAVTAIGTVGIAFWLVGGNLSTASKLEDLLLHGVTPIAALLFWIAFNAKAPLRWITALIWLVWPIAYFAYALTRGKLTGTYAYSFLDLNRESITSVATTTGMIIAVYAVVALIVLAINKWRAPRSSQG